MDRRVVHALAIGFSVLVLTHAAAADDTAATNSVLAPPASVVPPSSIVPAPLVGLDAGAALLAPPGTAALARGSGMAGSGSVPLDLSYIPPADRDSYLNSRDFAEHLQTSTRRGHHPSALSKLGGAAEAMAINGAIMGGTDLLLSVH